MRTIFNPYRCKGVTIAGLKERYEEVKEDMMIDWYWVYAVANPKDPETRQELLQFNTFALDDEASVKRLEELKTDWLEHSPKIKEVEIGYYKKFCYPAPYCKEVGCPVYYLVRKELLKARR